MSNVFVSQFRHLGHTRLPKFTGTRVMMLPVVIGNLRTLPDFVRHYSDVATGLFSVCANPDWGKVGYLTIDEKPVEAGSTHRRAGLHVDGGPGRAWGGGGAPWAGIDTGMLTVSSHVGCRAWSQAFTGEIGEEGSCEHLRNQLQSPGTLLKPDCIYWLGALCVHESIAQPESVVRQFVRLSLPSTAPWYEGYTRNPLGVLPTGPILPRRRFMDVA